MSTSRLRDGEIVAILGKSGSGKSTFLRILAGLVPPSDGVVEYRGHRVTEPVRGIAMVFQSYALFPWLTVLGNVELGLEALGVVRRRAAPAGGRRDRPDRARRVRERLSEGAVGRHAAARRLCPRARRQPRHPAARRAVLAARRADRGNLARRSPRSVGCQPHPDQGDRHGFAQYRGGGRNRRPHPDLQQRPRAHPRRDPGRAAAAARFRKRRVPPDRRPGLHVVDDGARPRRAARGEARADRHRLSPARRLGAAALGPDRYADRGALSRPRRSAAARRRGEPRDGRAVPADRDVAAARLCPCQRRRHRADRRSAGPMPTPTCWRASRSLPRRC